MATNGIRLEITEKVCELKIGDMSSLRDLVAVLVHNGYDVQVAPVYGEYPLTAIDHYAVRIGKKSEPAT